MDRSENILLRKGLPRLIVRITLWFLIGLYAFQGYELLFFFLIFLVLCIVAVCFLISKIHDFIIVDVGIGETLINSIVFLFCLLVFIAGHFLIVFSAEHVKTNVETDLSLYLALCMIPSILSICYIYLEHSREKEIDAELVRKFFHFFLLLPLIASGILLYDGYSEWWVSSTIAYLTIFSIVLGHRIVCAIFNGADRPYQPITIQPFVPVEPDYVLEPRPPAQPVTPVSPPFVPPVATPVKWPPPITQYATLDRSIKTYDEGTARDFYHVLHQIFAEFNRELFGNKLAPCAVEIEPMKEDSIAAIAYGGRKNEVPKLILKGDKMVPVEPDEKYIQIGMGFNYIKNSPFQKVLSTLAHEMAHVEEFQFGNYQQPHGPRWVSTMYSIGLIPTDTGEPGGKQNGEKMTHYIEAGGPFDRVSRRMIANWRTPSKMKDEDYD